MPRLGSRRVYRIGLLAPFQELPGRDRRTSPPRRPSRSRSGRSSPRQRTATRSRRCARPATRGAPAARRRADAALAARRRRLGLHERVLRRRPGGGARPARRDRVRRRGPGHEHVARVRRGIGRARDRRGRGRRALSGAGRGGVRELPRRVGHRGSRNGRARLRRSIDLAALDRRGCRRGAAGSATRRRSCCQIPRSGASSPPRARSRGWRLRCWSPTRSPSGTRFELAGMSTDLPAFGALRGMRATGIARARASEGGARSEIWNPNVGQRLASFPEATAEDVDAAVASAAPRSASGGRGRRTSASAYCAGSAT